MDCEECIAMVRVLVHILGRTAVAHASTPSGVGVFEGTSSVKGVL